MSQHHDVTRWVVKHITRDGSVPPEVVTDLLTMLDEDQEAQDGVPLDQAEPAPVSIPAEEVAADAPAE